MRHHVFVSVAVFGALAASGCFIVSPDHRDEVLGGGLDAGPQPVADGGDAAAPDGGGEDDAGGTPNVLQDRCGDPMVRYETLRDSRPPFLVDTRDLFNRISSCGSGSAPGNDGFLAIEVTAGDFWHFHVIPDPATPGQTRDPFLYLVQAQGSSCDTRACRHASNACLGGGDEHFAFVAPSNGIWYLGIDDVNPGGGVYQVEAVRLNCGDGIKVHGEACDGTSNCNSNCQEILSEMRPMEVEANDNEIEANFLTFTPGAPLTITGNIGGDLCTYPDVFNFLVPVAGSSLAVDILKTDGSICDSASLTPFDIVLRNAAGEVRAGSMTDPVSGCAELRVSDLSSASFFLYLEHEDPIEDRVVPYQLRIRITPP